MARTRMADLLDLSKLIPVRQVNSLSAQGEQFTMAVLAGVDRSLAESGSTALHKSLHQLLLRMLETSILSHPRISRLIDVWEGIAGTARERIEKHLVEILEDKPDENLVSHVFRCLSGSAAQRGRHSGSHAHYFDDVIDRLASSFSETGNPLRCECCGYHFRAKDVKNDRYVKISEAGFVFERALFPGRSDDPYKPVDRGNGTWTQLSIDHVIPEETLGWSDPDNLELLCMFCNSGKMAYRRPLEGISAFAVGALAEVPVGRPWGILKHQIIISALMAQGGVCCECGRTKREVELTVRPKPPLADSVHGFLPWNLRSVCYVCLAKSDEDELLYVSPANDEGYSLGLSAIELLEDDAEGASTD